MGSQIFPSSLSCVGGGAERVDIREGQSRKVVGSVSGPEEVDKVEEMQCPTRVTPAFIHQSAGLRLLSWPLLRTVSMWKTTFEFCNFHFVPVPTVTVMSTDV